MTHLRHDVLADHRYDNLEVTLVVQLVLLAFKVPDGHFLLAQGHRVTQVQLVLRDESQPEGPIKGGRRKGTARRQPPLLVTAPEDNKVKVSGVDHEPVRRHVDEQRVAARPSLPQRDLQVNVGLSRRVLTRWRHHRHFMWRSQSVQSAGRGDEWRLDRLPGTASSQET